MSNIMFPTSVLGLKKRKNRIIHDYDIQEFSNIDYKIKVQTIDERRIVILSFYDKDDNVMSVLPSTIFCRNITEKRDKIPFHESLFLLMYPNKYIFYLKDSQERKDKIYSINCKNRKSFQIYNYKARI
ncbi:5764_t:CDS:1 [Scutellospora calospora]|uniref:5764_t:CDS:1 n=1 Tax=Scutellospora calospora TaxID=85575 RepID=A0ACA9L420_9GLOM|nr:5764_t:CDS:1 [Scutellospora calospora]